MSSEVKSVAAKGTLAKAKVTAALDIEGNVPLESVQLDGLVVLKIIKHCHEFFPNPVTGQLLGLDVDRVLEVTNSFPFPGAKTDDEHELVDAAKYQVEMMRCLHDVNIDHNTVGWYQSTYLGSFVTHKLVETQFTQQSLNNKSVVIIHDVSQSKSGNLALSAYRFTQAFMEAHKEGKFTSESLVKNKLTFSKIFEELPIIIKNSHLVTALLHSLDDFENVIPKTYPISIDKESVIGPLTPNFETLELSLDPYMEKNLEFLLKSIEDNNYEQNNLAFWQKSVTKAQSALQKRKQDNEARKESGLDPLPEDDILKMYKIPPEPSRLDSLLISSQINNYCKQLNQHAGPTLSKLFVAKELQK
ncbi:4567_t:CDS:2 [Entrophospora sp. SA101]|nr:9466_t:CDS:2 [Entrophospora sp. SA101]CAJ0635415.1 16284_t:CDS:2 [Entrophospora sp. SA101]CAJ0752229.1 15091_t:CDS:2 [Entrophospora sp. SA101]CAJ0757113.1 4567_t:CDS:2 [Entrophospora sp. SA101]CAJ0835451.1 17152_t:CDS:2 [Entrophospora sp. SA101]